MGSGTPWGMINARRETNELRSLVSETVTAALSALEKPDGAERARQLLIELKRQAHL